MAVQVRGRESSLVVRALLSSMDHQVFISPRTSAQSAHGRAGITSSRLETNRSDPPRIHYDDARKTPCTGALIPRLHVDLSLQQ